MAGFIKSHFPKRPYFVIGVQIVCLAHFCVGVQETGLQVACLAHFFVGVQVVHFFGAHFFAAGVFGTAMASEAKQNIMAKIKLTFFI